MRALGLVRPMGDEEVPATPAEDSTVAYGHYLAETVANCRGCHTVRSSTGAYIPPDYAGQAAFAVTDDEGRQKHLVVPNLTPDPETGRMAHWTREVFIQRFRLGATIPGWIMPWGQFSRMTDVELTALYKFFQSLEPVRAAVPIPVGLQDGLPPKG